MAWRTVQDWLEAQLALMSSRLAPLTCGGGLARRVEPAERLLSQRLLISGCTSGKARVDHADEVFTANDDAIAQTTPTSFSLNTAGPPPRWPRGPVDSASTAELASERAISGRPWRRLVGLRRRPARHLAD